VVVALTENDGVQWEAEGFNGVFVVVVVLAAATFESSASIFFLLAEVDNDGDLDDDDELDDETDGEIRLRREGTTASFDFVVVVVVVGLTVVPTVKL